MQFFCRFSKQHSLQISSSQSRMNSNLLSGRAFKQTDLTVSVNGHYQMVAQLRQHRVSKPGLPQSLWF